MELIKELVRCYEYMHDVESPLNKEIVMWRYLFLDNIHKYADQSKNEHIKQVFMSISSKLLCEMDINLFIKDVILKYDEMKKSKQSFH